MTLHLVHTNDFHNRFPGKTLGKILSEPCLLLDSGDAIRGSNLAYHAREPILEEMGKTGYTAMAMGNREFHYLRGLLRTRLRAARFPILCSNIIDLRGEVEIPDHLVVSKGNLKIGLFSVTVQQFPPGSRWEKITGWRFLDPHEASKHMVKRLRDLGSWPIFCLSHLGFPGDRKLAEKVEGIQIILGGHSHTILPKPFRVGQTAIVQSGAYGQFVGRWLFEPGERGAWSLDGELIRGGF